MDRDLALQLITKLGAVVTQLEAVVTQLTAIAVNTTPADGGETEPTANTETRSAKK